MPTTDENMPDWGVFCRTKMIEAEGLQPRQSGQALFSYKQHIQEHHTN